MSNERKPTSTWSIFTAAVVCFILGILAVRYNFSLGGPREDGPPAVILFCGMTAFIVWWLSRVRHAFSMRVGLLKALWTRDPLHAPERLVILCLSFAYAVPIAFCLSTNVIVRQCISSWAFRMNAIYYIVSIGVIATGIMFVVLILLFAAFLKTLMRFGWLSTSRSRLAVLFGLTIVWMAGIGWMSHDVPPARMAFSMDQLSVPPENAEQSYRLVQAYRMTNRLPDAMFQYRLSITSPAFRSNALAHAVEIETAWAEAVEGRTLLDQLNKFNGIGDLTEPMFNGLPFDFRPWRNLAQIYWAHAFLLCEQNRPGEAVQVLAQLESVVRKMVPYSRTLVHKMICIAILSGNMSAAQTVLCDPRTDAASLLLLRDAFNPIAWEDISLRDEMIFGAISSREWLGNMQMADVGQFTHDATDYPPMQHAVMCLLSPLVYHRNRTMNDVETSYKLLAESASSFPQVYPASADKWSGWESNRRVPLRNPVGVWLIRMSHPSFVSAFNQANRTKVGSDLLALEIAHKLGESLTLNDPWTGEPYRVDSATGTFSSSGPDKMPDTKDDIRLPLDKWP